MSLRVLLYCACLLSIAPLSTPLSASAQPTRATTPLRVRFVMDGTHTKLQAIRDDIAKAVTELLQGRRAVDLNPSRDRTGDFTLATAKKRLQEALDADDTDLVIALGAMTGVAVGSQEALNRPVIVPYTLDPELAGLPFDKGTSGRTHLTYIRDGIDIAGALRRFHEVHKVATLHVLVSEATAQAAPGLVAHLRSLSPAVGAQVEVLQTRHTHAEAIVRSLPTDVQGLFLSPLARLEEEDWSPFFALSNARGVPVFAFGGREACERGALGSITSEQDRIRRARRTANFVERYLDGEKLAQLPVSFVPTEALYLNLEVAERTGARPDWITLTEAELVGQLIPKDAPTLSLTQTLNEVVERNLDLAAAQSSVRSADEQVKLSRAPLLPQLGLSAGVGLIDGDRADAPNSPGQLSANWQATLSQRLYSPRSLGALEAQKHSRNATGFGRDTTRLDVILQAGEAHIQVLRALAALRVRRENLALTRANLQRARLRVRVGRSSEAEIVRWKASLTTAQHALLVAFGQLRTAEIELNRTLNRPLSERVRLEEADRSPAALIQRPDGVETGPLTAYLHDPWSFETLTDFLSDEGVRNSPEIRQLDAAIQAQRRRLKRTRESLFVPDISATVSVAHNFADVGGQNPRDLPMGGIDAFDVQAGLNASLPLSAGGQRYATIRQASVEVRQLEQRRSAVSLRVEQGVRSQMAALAPAFANIELSRRAREAAERNLELIHAAYLAGSTDIVRVLDAQTQAIQARLAAATAMYDLMIRILRAERSSGRFRYFAGAEERADLLKRLAQFSADHTHSPNPNTPTPSPEPR